MTKELKHKFDSKFLNFLLRIGLEKNEALVYEILVQSGPMIAHSIALELQMTRPLVYKVLQELEGYRLVTKRDNFPSKVRIFEALSPNNLDQFVQTKNLSFIDAKSSFDELAPKLNSLFTSRYHKTSIQYFVGAKGLSYLHADILREKQDILLFRSFLDQSEDETRSLIQKQREQQALLGIKVRLISPRTVNNDLLQKDKKYHIVRKYIDPAMFSIPSQIVVYGKKVGIVSYVDGVHTTMINNEAVNSTVKSIFELLWVIAKDPINMLAEV